MVWALILSVLLLSFPSPVLAEPVDEGDGSMEVVPADNPDLEDSDEDVEGDSEVSEEPTEPDTVDSEPVSVEVTLPETDTTFYDEYGVEVMSTAEPDARLSAVSTSTPYASVTGGTYYELASLTRPKMGWADDYVFWRSGQYSYSLAYGDLSFDSGTFTGSGLHLIHWTYSSSQTGYLMTEETSDLSLRVNSCVVYSNLGNFPILDHQADNNCYLAFMGVVAVCLYLIRSLFGFVLRMGVRTVNE